MLADILARLRATLPEAHTPEVVMVEDIDLLEDIVGRLENGSVVVAPWRERAMPSPISTGGFRQFVAGQFLAGVVIRAFDQQAGEDRALQFDAHVRRLEQALAGWEPPGAAPCQLVDGESSPVTKGVSIYVQTWETSRFLTGATS